MKIRHYSLFKELRSANIDWDLLRDSMEEENYYIPFNRHAYITSIAKECPAKERLANIILEFCRVKRLKRIISIGSGRCVLEYVLKKKSHLRIEVSDTSESINRISSFHIFDNAYQFNLLEDTVRVFDGSTLILLSRIDTEFEDEDLKRLFDLLQEKGARYVCFIPAELLKLRILLAEIKIRIIGFVRNQKPVFCGYARTKSEYQKAWEQYYSEDSHAGKEDIFFLNSKV